MAQNEKRTSKIILDGSQPAKTINDLAADIKILGNSMRKLDKDSQAFKTAAAKMRELKGELGTANAEMRNTSTAWGRMWKSIKITAAGVLLGNILTTLTQMVTRVIPELIKRNAELSDSYADIQKTTELTNEEVKRLDKTMSGFNTRTAKKELREIAVEAGRLGIRGVKNISDFVQAADKIKVALGDDLGNDVKGNLRVIGKLTEQYKVAENAQVEFGEAILKTGSAINELSASGSTQADYLINFTKRTTGVAVSANLTIDSVLALGSTLDEASQNVEVSATTINKVLTKMFTDADLFANIAGMGLKEFQHLLEQDAMGALTVFLEGLRGNNEGLTQLAGKLEDAELTGARATAVLAALANNTKKLSEKQIISNTALAEGTSLTEEFNTKNNNLAATVDKIGKKMRSVWLNSGLRKGVTWLIESFGSLIGVNEELNVSIEDQQVELTQLGLQISRLNVGSTERVKLVNKLKSIYPEYLDWLDGEKSTNYEIANAIAMVNDKLVERMILQEEDAKVLEHTKKVAAEKRKLLDLEMEADRQLAVYAVHRGVEFDKEADRLTQIQQAQQFMSENPVRGFGSAGSFVGGPDHKSLAVQIQEVTANLDQLKKVSFEMELEKSKIMNALGITGPVQGPDAAPRKTGGGSGFIPTEEEFQQKADKMKEQYATFLAEMTALNDEVALAKLATEEQEMARIDARYDKELEKLTAFLEAKEITEEEWQLRADEINLLRQEEKDILEQERRDKLAADKAKFLEELDDLDKRGAEGEIDAVNKKYDKLLDLAKQYGIDLAIIEELRQAELASIRDYYRDVEVKKETDYRAELMSVYSDFGNAISGFMQSMGEEQSSWAEFSRGIAFFQLAMSQAQAISNALVTTTSAKDPANTLTGGLAGLVKFATISTAILTTIAGARNLIRGENIPSHSSNRFERGGFYSTGPMHAAGGSKIVDGTNGMIQGELEGNEAILSRDTVAQNFGLVNALVESGKNGGGRIPQFNYSRMTEAASTLTASSSNTLDASELLIAAQMIKDAVGNIEANVIFSNGLIRDLRKNIALQERLENKRVS